MRKEGHPLTEITWASSHQEPELTIMRSNSPCPQCLAAILRQGVLLRSLHPLQSGPWHSTAAACQSCHPCAAGRQAGNAKAARQASMLFPHATMAPSPLCSSNGTRRTGSARPAVPAGAQCTAVWLDILPHMPAGRALWMRTAYTPKACSQRHQGGPRRLFWAYSASKGGHVSYMLPVFFTMWKAFISALRKLSKRGWISSCGIASGKWRPWAAPWAQGTHMAHVDSAPLGVVVDGCAARIAPTHPAEQGRR